MPKDSQFICDELELAMVCRVSTTTPSGSFLFCDLNATLQARREAIRREKHCHINSRNSRRSSIIAILKNAAVPRQEKL
jgi:hypothetical protein